MYMDVGWNMSRKSSSLICIYSLIALEIRESQSCCEDTNIYRSKDTRNLLITVIKKCKKQIKAASCTIKSMSLGVCTEKHKAGFCSDSLISVDIR